MINTVRIGNQCISYEQAMNRWGCDKPDLRYGLEIEDVSDLIAKTEGNFLKGKHSGQPETESKRYPR